MRDSDIDGILYQAGKTAPQVDPTLLDRISSEIGTGLQPVRPMPPGWMLGGALVLICAAVGIGGAVLLGMSGLHKMSGVEGGLIFSVLATGIVLSGVACLGEAIPGSRRMVSPAILTAGICAGLVAVFLLVFRDYNTTRFVAQGIPCLRAGLIHAVPTAAAVWWVLRRGFAVNPAASGFARGTLAGLAGVLMLELHCPDFEVSHVIVWHTLVIPISAALAALAARTMRHRD